MNKRANTEVKAISETVMLRKIYTLLPGTFVGSEPKEIIRHVTDFLELALLVLGEKRGFPSKDPLAIARMLASAKKPKNRWPKNLWSQIIKVLRLYELVEVESEKQWCMRACLELDALGIHLPWNSSAKVLLPFLCSRLLELCRYAMRAVMAKPSRAEGEVQLISPCGHWKTAPSRLEAPFTVVVRPSGIAINGWILPVGAISRPSLGWLRVQLEALMEEESPERIQAIVEAIEQNLASGSSCSRAPS